MWKKENSNDPRNFLIRRDFNIGDTIVCKETYSGEIAYPNGSYFKFKRGEEYKILHEYKDSGGECTERFYYVGTKDDEYICKFHCTKIKFIAIPFFYDYFCSIVEMRKIKLKKLNNESQSLLC